MMKARRHLAIHAEALRSAMRSWATGVTVVTAAAGGRRHGMTVSSFTSISLDPPLVLVSLANTTLTGDLVRRCGHFGVTILSQGQEAISEAFAGRVPEEGDRFSGFETELLASGVPFLKGGLAYFDCRLVETVPSGGTTLFLGEVTEARTFDGQPLVYFNRDYQGLC